MVKFYRAIEFSNLQFLLDEDQYIFWIDRDLNFANLNSMNWWLESNSETLLDRKKVISTVANNPNEIFFNKSAEFNSVFGGRFNPPKSFGGIYCANSPFVSSLEVLYHFFISSLNTLKPISKNKSAVQSLLNSRFKNKIQVIIVSFEFECEPSSVFHTLNDSELDLRDVCNSLGFSRYLSSENFDRNFIFGNDYDFSRIIGCHLHTQETNGFKVPSARLDFNDQDSLMLRNYFIPEKNLDLIKPKLTGKFKEYKFTFSADENDDGFFDIKMETFNSDIIVERDFSLEPIPTKKPIRHPGASKQIISYEHNANVGPKRSLREVHVQKFFKLNI